MKKILLVFLLLSFFIFPAHVYAYDWPPPAYDMPRVIYDVDAWKLFSDSMNVTLRSIGAKGFLIMCSMLIVFLISYIPYRFFIGSFYLFRRVAWRSRDRLVKDIDIALHRPKIVADKVRDMEIGFEAREIFNRKHEEELIEARVWSLGMNAEAWKRYRGRKASVEEKIFHNTRQFADHPDSMKIEARAEQDAYSDAFEIPEKRNIIDYKGFKVDKDTGEVLGKKNTNIDL